MEHIRIADTGMSYQNMMIAQELLDSMSALLMVYPNGGHGDSDDRGDAVNLALETFEKVTGNKFNWPASGAVSKSYIESLKSKRVS